MSNYAAYYYPFTFTFTGATTLGSYYIYDNVIGPPLKWAPPKPAPNPYAVDPDARHLARIRRELEAPWVPPRKRP